VDFGAFDQTITRANAAGATDPAAARRLYAEAVDLYTGLFLPGVYDTWADVHREWLRSRALFAMERLAEASMSAGDHVGVLDTCRRMLEIEPYREATYEMLMVLHGCAGQTAQVQRWYQMCTRRLTTTCRWM
jgi:two-component SAPR family response regulator